MTAGFTPENLATRGMTLKGSEKVTLSGQAATLYHLSQSAGGTAFEKWIAATGDEKSAVLIVGTFPESKAQSMSAPIREAVLSGAGIGFMDRREAARDDSLVEVIEPLQEWFGNLWLVTHVDLHRTTKVQSFLKYLKDQSKGWKA